MEGGRLEGANGGVWSSLISKPEVKSLIDERLTLYCHILRTQSCFRIFIPFYFQITLFEISYKTMKQETSHFLVR